jgi:pyruvate dehydrogenase (quinone)
VVAVIWITIGTKLNHMVPVNNGCWILNAPQGVRLDSLKSPIVHALRGKEHVEWDNPFDVGLTGWSVSLQATARWKVATCYRCWASTSIRALLPEGARTAQIEIRSEAIGRRATVELGLVGDVSSILPALLGKFKEVL